MRTVFTPINPMKRAEVFEILSRVLNVSEPNSNQINAELSKYEDGNKVPDWERTAVAEASLAGIVVNNKNPNLLNPSAIATRGENRAFLSKLEDSGVLKNSAIGEGRQPIDKPNPRGRNRNRRLRILRHRIMDKGTKHLAPALVATRLPAATRKQTGNHTKLKCHTILSRRLTVSLIRSPHSRNRCSRNSFSSRFNTVNSHIKILTSRISSSSPDNS